jgi:hypothetical protein
LIADGLKVFFLLRAAVFIAVDTARLEVEQALDGAVVAAAMVAAGRAVSNCEGATAVAAAVG